jgi:hypothetical protein
MAQMIAWWVMMESVAMRVIFFGALLVTLAGAQQPPISLATRYDFDVIPSKYPQKTPEEALHSVVLAVEGKRMDYLLAQLADPAFVDKKVAEYKSQLKGEERSRTLLAFDRLVRETAKYFQDDPILIQELKRFAKEGEWKTDAAAAVCTAKTIPGRRVFMRKVQQRWFLENKQK